MSITTREWLDPQGPLRRPRRLVGALFVISTVGTAVGFGVLGTTEFLVGGLLAIAVTAVSYLVAWAADLVAVYVDPDGPGW